MIEGGSQHQEAILRACSMVFRPPMMKIMLAEAGIHHIKAQQIDSADIFLSSALPDSPKLPDSNHIIHPACEHME